MDLKELRLAGDSKRHPWELARREVVADKVRRLAQRYALNKQDCPSIIDIGCGDAYLVEFLAEKFPHFHFVGVDSNFSVADLSNLRETYEGQANLSVHKTLDEARPDISEHASLVTLLDVVEHIEHDMEFLRDLLQDAMISADTMFFITVPAFQNLFCAHDTFLEHYRRYDMESLRQMLQVAGFEVLEKGYFFLSLMLPRYLQVRRERKQPQPQESFGVSQWQHGGLVTSAVKVLLLLDYMLFRHLNLPGLSCYAICKPSA